MGRSGKDPVVSQRKEETSKIPVEPDLPKIEHVVIGMLEIGSSFSVFFQNFHVFFSESQSNGSKSNDQTFESPDGKEFIAVEPVEPHMRFEFSQLQCSARILHAGMGIVLHNYGCLMLVGDNFVAKARMQFRGALTKVTSFDQAKTVLLR